jgi:hypothetical protein
MKTKKDTNPKSFLRKGKGASLNPDFLASLRENLALEMKMNPVMEIESPSSSRRIYYYAMAPALAALVLVFVAGGTTFASQKSLPGDPLYPVKILAERINVATAFTARARSKVRLASAAERVNEATKLAQINSALPLSSNAQFHENMQSVITDFNNQITNTLEEERNLKENNNSEEALNIANDIQNATSTFNNILLSAKGENGGEGADDVNRLINSNNDLNARAGIDSKRTNDEKDSSNQPVFKTDKNDFQDKHPDQQKNKGRSDNDENKSASQVTAPVFSTPILAAPSFAPVSDKTLPNNPDRDSQNKHGNENDNKPVSSPSVLFSPTSSVPVNTSNVSLPVEQKKSDSGNGGDSQKKESGNKNDGGNSLH